LVSDHLQSSHFNPESYQGAKLNISIKFSPQKKYNFAMLGKVLFLSTAKYKRCSRNEQCNLPETARVYSCEICALKNIFLTPILTCTAAVTVVVCNSWRAAQIEGVSLALHRFPPSPSCPLPYYPPPFVFASRFINAIAQRNFYLVTTDQKDHFQLDRDFRDDRRYRLRY
jgi:hypothetical protein